MAFIIPLNFAYTLEIAKLKMQGARIIHSNVVLVKVALLKLQWNAQSACLPGENAIPQNSSFTNTKEFLLVFGI